MFAKSRPGDTSLKNINMLKKVKEALAQVIDPETGLNIMRMDLIHDLSVDEHGDVSLTFRPSSPVCPMAYALANEIKKTLTNIESVREVSIAVENFHDAERLEQLLNA